MKLKNEKKEVNLEHENFKKQSNEIFEKLEKGKLDFKQFDNEH